ncbi:efflux RND transporter permease subunit [Metabacillus sp. 84]|uniref:efflux RND transporter permease subunit n=1 Tax=Metabacillus sp. 84 TaxID=3404705 RepID=UPI003CF04D6E
MNLNRFTKFSLKNAIAVLILTVLVLASGLAATQSIKTETYPDVTFPVISVQAVYPNASTEEVEESVTKPIEEKLLNVKGYESVSSESSENAAVFQIMYEYGKDLDEAKAEIEEAIGQASLPEKANEPEVRTLSIDMQPIYKAAFSGNDLREMQAYIEDTVVPELEEKEGVQQVTLTGVETDSLKIEVDEEKAAEKGISLADVQSAVENQQYKIPAGTLTEDGEKTPLQVEGSIGDLEELKNIEVKSSASLSRQAQPPQQAPAQGTETGQARQQSQGSEQAQGESAPVLLSDIADITTVKNKSNIARYNGKDSIILQVTKTQEGNTAETAKLVRETAEKAAADQDYTLHTVADQGAEVEESIESLLKEGGYGALFTVLIILLFLRNFRATIIAVVSLPVSILGTILLLNQFDYTLNIMTLGGMAVAIGRIVDDSIVVIENIYRWKQKHPDMPQKPLVFKAVKEVMGPIASSTIATLIVFLPLAFVGGILGEFFRPFSLAVVFSISISLIVAIMLIPVLGSGLFKKVKPLEHKAKWAGAYEKFLRGALKRKVLVFAASIVLLIGSFAAIPVIGLSFIPTGQATSLEVKVELPESATLEQTNETAKKIEEDLNDEKDIAYSQASIGFSEIRSFEDAGKGSSENTAVFFIELKEGTDMNQALEKYENKISSLAKEDAKEAIVTAAEVQEDGPPSGNSVEVSLYGNHLESLRSASGQVEDLLAEDGRLKTIQNDMEETQTKYSFALSEEGRNLNIQPTQISQPISERVNGIKDGTVTINEEEWDLELAFDETPASKEDIQSLTIQTQEGEKELGVLMEITEAEVPVSIRHEDGRTQAMVSGIIKTGDTARVTEDLQQDLQSLKLPDNVDLEVGGGQEMISEGLEDLGLAMLAAVVLVFLVLGITFGGILTPLVILSSLIFIPVGSLTALLITGETLSMPAMIGMLMLIGIVVTNAVVLLDRAESNRKDGMGLTDSIIEASVTRLRPILMTALATIFALVPLSLSDSASGVISKGLAIAVIGGLTTSTLLTLVFIPALYNAVGKWRTISAEDELEDR